MDDPIQCERLAAELNETEGWGLPAEAIADLARAVLPFVKTGMLADELGKVIHNFQQHSRRVALMMTRGNSESEKAWDGVQMHFANLVRWRGIFGADAEDVAQEACRKAMEELETYQFRGSLDGWLTRIVQNECNQWIRKRRKQLVCIPLETFDSGEESQDVQHELVDRHQHSSTTEQLEQNVEMPDRVLTYTERVTALRQAVDRLLSSKQLMILYYSFIETDYKTPDGRTAKWTDVEIAKSVGLAPGSIAQTRDRLLQRLRADPDFRQIVVEFFGADWLDQRTPVRKGRVTKRPPRASSTKDEPKERR